MIKCTLVKTVILVMLVSLTFGLCGCVIGYIEEPYLDDRTEGWNPQLIINVDFLLDELDAEASVLWKAILDFKPYTYPEKVSVENFDKAADEAIKLNLNKPYSETCKDSEIVDYGNVVGIINDSVVVVFASSTGRLKFCADITNHSELSRHLEYLQFTANAASLTADELAEIQRASGFENAPSRVDLKAVSLPLTAQGAYDLSVNMDVKSWHGSSRLAATGGPFRVYYSNVSDAFFVVTNTYIQAFEASTGELLLMHSYGEVRLNEHPYGRDDSLKK